jgi:hypothetical protein
MRLDDCVPLRSTRQDLDLNERDCGYAARHARRVAVISITPFHFQRFVYRWRNALLRMSLEMILMVCIDT